MKAKERSRRYYEQRACEARNELAKAKQLLAGLVTLVEYWAPKDGTPRTADERAFLGMPQLTSTGEK